MKKTRKEQLLKSFPCVPQEHMEKMKGRGARNFAIYLTNGDELFIRCYHRYYAGELAERQRYVFAKDGYVRYGVNSNGSWSARSEFREPVFCQSSYGYNFDNSYTTLGEENICRSCMKYSQVLSYHGNYPIEYLRLYCKQPNLEYLIKSGYEPFTERVTGFWGNIVHIELDSKINWKSNNLLKMLHLNRTEFAILKGRENYYDAYIEWRSQIPRYKPDELFLLAKVFGFDFGSARHFCESTGLKPKRIAAYLAENEIEKHDYNDYLSQCRTLNYNLHDTAINMPHNFNAAHERLSEIINYESNQKLRILMSGLYDSRRCLEFVYDGYVVRQPDSPDEIIHEGSELSHCVGGYAERHAKGILTILFIRKLSDPDTPFYTMELSAKGKIVQVRGYKNCAMTDEVAEFVRKYKIYLSKIFYKKESKTA